MIESYLTDKILKLYKKHKVKNTHDKKCAYTCLCLFESRFKIESPRKGIKALLRYALTFISKDQLEIDKKLWALNKLYIK